MKYAIQTWGSNGDIRPMIALAEGLKQSGHEVTLAISSIDNQQYEPLCKQLGINTYPVSGAVNFDLQDFAQRTFRMNTLQWLRALLDEMFFPFEQYLYQAACDLAESHDVLIGHHILYPLKPAAKQQCKPFISILFCHTIVETPHQAPFHIPDLSRFLNPLAWRILDIVFDCSLKKRLSQLWLSHGINDIEHVISDLFLSDDLNSTLSDYHGY